MGTIFGIFIFFAVVFILYLTYIKPEKTHGNSYRSLNRNRTQKFRYEKMMESEKDSKSIEEIQRSLDDVTKSLQENLKLLEELQESEEDQEEESPYSECHDVGNPYSFNKLRVALTYRDASGNMSNRTVDVASFDGYYINGHCHLRKAYRTFVVERVISLADGDTGETVSNPCSFFKEKYMHSPSYVIDKIFDEYRDVLRVLLYVVKVDGRYTKHEKVLVRDLVRTLNSSDIELDDKIIDDLMKDIEIPSIHSFRIAVGKVIKRESLPFDLTKEVEAIIASDGKVDAREEETLEYIKKRIQKG